MRNGLLMSAILTCLVLVPAFSDAGAGVIINPVVKPQFKFPRYSVTGHGKPLIGDQITVKRGPNGLLNVTINTEKGKKTITSPFVELEGKRLLPALQHGIELNGKAYASAILGRSSAPYGEWRQKSEGINTTGHKIVFEEEDNQIDTKHGRSTLHAHIEPAHPPHNEVPKKESSRHNCNEENSEKCK